MSHFAEVNLIYQSYFRSIPPARTCVAVNLMEGKRVEMEVLAFKSPPSKKNEQLKKRSLQVRSLSYWAPAVIGPYSQAVMVRYHFDTKLVNLR
jgi:diphthine-ammonia ligase